MGCRLVRQKEQVERPEITFIAWHNQIERYARKGKPLCSQARGVDNNIVVTPLASADKITLEQVKASRPGMKVALTCVVAARPLRSIFHFLHKPTAEIRQLGGLPFQHKSISRHPPHHPR